MAGPGRQHTNTLIVKALPVSSAEQAVSPLLGATLRVLHIRRVDRTHER